MPVPEAGGIGGEAPDAAWECVPGPGAPRSGRSGKGEMRFILPCPLDGWDGAQTLYVGQTFAVSSRHLHGQGWSGWLRLTRLKESLMA